MGLGGAVGVWHAGALFVARVLPVCGPHSVDTFEKADKLDWQCDSGWERSLRCFTDSTDNVPRGPPLINVRSATIADGSGFVVVMIYLSRGCTAIGGGSAFVVGCNAWIEEASTSTDDLAHTLMCNMKCTKSLLQPCKNCHGGTCKCKDKPTTGIVSAP